MSGVSEVVTIDAVGDVLIDRDDPSTAFADVAGTLAESDLRFGNCEAVYSETKERLPGIGGQYVAPPECFEALREARFDVMTLANNHAMDGGYSGLADTLERLHAAGIATVGGGLSFEDARRPAILEARGVRIGFLGYTCVFAPGTGARGSRPGLATVDVHTVYRGEVGQPGTRPLVQTYTDARDKAAVAADVARTREQSDVVIVGFHWGIHLLPAVLTDYERELARTVVDAGADVVLGHHQHILKGVELYRGKPILYGLGNFAIDHRHLGEALGVSETLHGFGAFYGDYRGMHRPESPTFPFHPESRRTVIARLRVAPGRDPEVALLPCLIDGTATPRRVEAGTPEFAEHRDYLADITARESLNAEFSTDGDAIAVGERA